MKLEIVDTNVILRFLVGDNQEQFEQAKTWFKEAQQGKRKLIVKPIVVAETCFVLESFYQKSRQEIREALEVFLSQKWLKVYDREILTALWPLYVKDLHFVDSFLITWVQINQASILSFDKQLQKN